GKFSNDSTLAHREHAVRDGEHFLEVGRRNQYRFAARRKIPNNVVDLVFSADVDPLSRLVEKKHIGVRREPLRQNNLLLIAARQPLGRVGKKNNMGRPPNPPPQNHLSPVPPPNPPPPQHSRWQA